ncbi:HlyD family secretion protein [Halobacillus karajensis]|uniref:Efflux system component YknX n=1 Tax=Halobacillus karajensis TaxID=195088 RepID=A0A024PAJ8_9BACI|nr:HlyD family efflux transporter periplasmic adaptor subunit [Halobacillus karajensis]CDQ21523.1 Putative efflux system component YknX [Halobacillus karajensis]CDQ25457.1 Putative efflux system component YknX [Halobacillus karajensis]CDQ29012.1 Putative efflux system component YknX [Halobacillus karajensis]SEI09292.1 HlyD family secretion protein [Halobacillus karajensis]
MKKINGKGRIIGLLIIAFITTNAFLIFLDEEERVDRKSYIDEWSKSITYDLFEKMETKAVFTSKEKEAVYFDENTGSFNEFLVKEGDTVSEGDELYTYNVLNYYQEEARLQSEIDRLEEEMEAISSFINEIESYRVPDPPETEDNSGLFNNDTSSNEETPPSYVETEYLKEEKIAEQEAELAKQEAMLEMVENQLDQLQNDGDQITVTSAFSGTVTNISESLEAPLLTLESPNLVLEGAIHEQDRSQVKEEMTVEIYVPELDYETTGTLSSVDQFPQETDVNRLSRYPFTVTLDQPSEDLLPGYHAELKVITEEALGVVTALDTALETDENLYAWVMDEEGMLERRAIETGLEDKGLVEIVSGLEDGEWLAVKPKDEFRNGAVFFTPLHTEDLQVQEVFNIERRSMLSYGLLGLLSR